MKFTDFYEAYQFLEGHPMFVGRFHNSLEIDVVKVNPANKTIDDDESKNTLVQVWLETGPFEFIEETGRYEHTHDYELDTGGDTFEEAIINLAKLVWEHHGEYTEADQEAASRKWYEKAKEMATKGHK